MSSPENQATLEFYLSLIGCIFLSSAIYMPFLSASTIFYSQTLTIFDVFSEENSYLILLYLISLGFSVISTVLIYQKKPLLWPSLVSSIMISIVIIGTIIGVNEYNEENTIFNLSISSVDYDSAFYLIIIGSLLVLSSGIMSTNSITKIKRTISTN